MPRILHFAENFLPQLGGAELAIHELVHSQCKAGADSRVLADYWNERRRVTFPYPVIQFPKSRLYSNRTWTFAALSCVYLGWRFDTIHFQWTVPSAFWALQWRHRLGLRSKIKIVITPSGADLNVVPEIGYGNLLNISNLPRARRVLAEADALLPTSSNMAVRMAELAPGSASKIQIIPRGCHVAKFTDLGERRAAARKRFGMSMEDFVLMSVGRPAKVKNYELMLQVLLRAVRHIPGIRLLSVGDRNKELLILAQELGIAERIRFTGRFPPADADPNELLDLPHPGMLDALAASDVGISTSYVEGYSNANVEQGAAGLPLVVGRTNGIQDRIPADFRRFVLDELDEELFVDRLVTLYSDRELYRAYSRAIQASFAPWTHEYVAKALLKAYQSCQNGNR